MVDEADSKSEVSEAVRVRRADILVKLADEYQEDSKKAFGAIDRLVVDESMKGLVSQNLQETLELSDRRIISAAHGGPHITRVLSVCEGIVAKKEAESRVESFPPWLKLALVITAVNHDTGAVPKEKGERNEQGDEVIQTERQEQAYVDHERKGVVHAETAVDSLDENLLKEKFGVSKEELKNLVAVLTMATSVELDILPAFAGHAQGLLGDQLRDSLPMISIIQIARQGGVEGLKKYLVQLEETIRDPKKVKSVKDQQVYTSRLLKLAERHSQDQGFWQQMENGVTTIAAADHSSYFRKAIVPEISALYFGFGQLWQAEESGRETLRHRQPPNETLESFLLDVFPKVAFATYSDWLPAETIAAYQLGQKAREEILKDQVGGQDPCLRLEGAISAVDLYRIAEKFSLEQDPGVQEKLLLFGDSLLRATKDPKTAGDFGPLASGAIREIVTKLKPEEKKRLIDLMLEEISKDLVDTGRRETTNLHVHVAPGVYDGKEAVSLIAQAANEKNIFVDLVVRQDRTEDTKGEFLAAVLEKVAENPKLGIAIAGFSEPSNLRKILTGIRAVMIANPEIGNRIFIHWGSVKEEGGESENKLAGSFKEIGDFVKKSGNLGKIWLHLDRHYGMFMKWAQENQEQWQVFKNKVSFTVSPYRELMAGGSPAEHEFWDFRDWLKEEKVDLTAATNNLHSGLGLAIQRLMLTLD